MAFDSSNPKIQTDLKMQTDTGVRSRLTCAQCERMVQDELDGVLGAEDQAQFNLHLATCTACSKALADAQRGAAWMEMLRIAPPEPPSTLVSSILAQTSGNPSVALPVLRAEAILHHGSANVLPFRAPVRTVWARLPMMAQPRFAMTAAMAFFSVALTMNLTGVHLSDIHASDLRPASLKRKAWETNARAVRYYDNLRVVYELQSRVRELQRDNGDSEQRPPAKQNSTDDKAPASPVVEPETKRGFQDSQPQDKKSLDKKSQDNKSRGSEPRSGDPAIARPEPRPERQQSQKKLQADRMPPAWKLVSWPGATRPGATWNATATRGEGARA